MKREIAFRPQLETRCENLHSSQVIAMTAINNGPRLSTNRKFAAVGALVLGCVLLTSTSGCGPDPEYCRASDFWDVSLEAKDQISAPYSVPICSSEIVELATGTYRSDFVSSEVKCSVDQLEIERTIKGFGDHQDCEFRVLLLGNPEAGGIEAGPAPTAYYCDGNFVCSYEFHSRYERYNPNNFAGPSIREWTDPNEP